MADDVKVKFGGDFSDIPKGAADAAEKAGTAITSNIGKYLTGVGTAFLGAFAIGSIVSRAFEGITHGLEYFRELDLTTRRIGIAGDEFQRLAYVGKQSGVTMEMLGRSLQFANKFIGQAQQGSISHQKALEGVTGKTWEMIKGTVKATDVLMGLADAWDRTQDETMLAAQAQEFFGKSGQALLPIIKQGRDAIEEQAGQATVFTKQEILAASAAQKMKLALEAEEAKLGKRLAAEASMGLMQEQILHARQNVNTEGMTDEQAETERAKSVAAYFKHRFGWTTAQTAEMMKLGTKNVPTLGMGITGPSVGLADTHQYDIAATLEKLAEKESKENKPEEPAAIAETYVPLSVSSLQAIGGGDIGSIMSGFHVDIQQEQLDVQKQIATNTTPAPAGSAKTIVNVAK